jgi:hypothetical protein
MAPAVGAGGVHQLLDLALGQVLTRPGDRTVTFADAEALSTMSSFSMVSAPQQLTTVTMSDGSVTDSQASMRRMIDLLQNGH